MINENQFKTYLEIRNSGATNMYDLPSVVRLSDYTLTTEECRDIMRNFSLYLEMYG